MSTARTGQDSLLSFEGLSGWLLERPKFTSYQSHHENMAARSFWPNVRANKKAWSAITGEDDQGMFHSGDALISPLAFALYYSSDGTV